MNIYNKIKAICNEKEKVLMFIDMDGTIAEYEFFTKEYQEQNKDGLFINIRPLTSVIDCLKQINEIPNIELYILSICMYEHDKTEKMIWLDKYVSFVKKENRIVLTMENNEYTKETKFNVKAKYISELLKDNEHAVILEDTHENMKIAKELLGDKVTNFHISSFVN